MLGNIFEEFCVFSGSGNSNVKKWITKRLCISLPHKNCVIYRNPRKYFIQQKKILISCSLCISANIAFMKILQILQAQKRERSKNMKTWKYFPVDGNSHTTAQNITYKNQHVPLWGTLRHPLRCSQNIV